MKIRIAAALAALSLSGIAQAGLTNGGFELPTFPANQVNFPASATVPGWNSNSNVIEVWTTAFNGVSAYQGNQFIELNGTQAATVWQGGITGIAAGATVAYQFAHRGRAGTDTMTFSVLDTSANNTVFSRSVSTGSGAWTLYTGTFVSTGGTLRFNYAAGATAGNNATVGNFLDAADFRVIPEPSALALVGLGLLAIGASRRKQA